MERQEHFSLFQDRLMRPLVKSTFLYACESWTLTADLQRRIRTMEMRCYRKIPCISYKDHITNEEVYAKTQQAIVPHEDMLTIVKRCRLQWYGHISSSSGLAKTTLRGTMKGGKKTRQTEKRDVKTRSGNGQACSSLGSKGQWRTGKNEVNWL